MFVFLMLHRSPEASFLKFCFF